jgi:hypothetical protein
VEKRIFTAETQRAQRLFSFLPSIERMEGKNQSAPERKLCNQITEHLYPSRPLNERDKK